MPRTIVTPRAYRNTAIPPKIHSFKVPPHQKTSWFFCGVDLSQKTSSLFSWRAEITSWKNLKSDFFISFACGQLPSNYRFTWSYWRASISAHFRYGLEWKDEVFPRKFPDVEVASYSSPSLLYQDQEHTIIFWQTHITYDPQTRNFQKIVTIAIDYCLVTFSIGSSFEISWKYRLSSKEILAA